MHAMHCGGPAFAAFRQREHTPQRATPAPRAAPQLGGAGPWGKEGVRTAHGKPLKSRCLTTGTGNEPERFFKALVCSHTSRSPLP